MSTAVVSKIEGILTSAFSMDNYVDLMNEVFDGMKKAAPDKFHKEFSNFSSHIEGYYHVGSYTAPDHKSILILAVKLKSMAYVENSRATQRSYAKKLIESGGVDAAMVAFFTEGDERWRLSFVRLDYEMKIENGRMKTAENLTPARRYSFLVGKDEPCHTAIDRFYTFITSGNSQPTLDDMENAFSVERVTSEFFNLYCEKFQQLHEALEANEDFRIEAEQHNFTSVQFAKKLMGQIVFLYFLQKKGWLGVSAWPRELNAAAYKKAYYARGARSRALIPQVYRQVNEDCYRVSARALASLSNEDEEILAGCVNGDPWGTGPRNFMRKLFEVSEQHKANFFDDYLEPLFYDALNRNRGEQGYDPALHCRIPFLSGGLFEPIDGYDWEHNDFDLPNSIFSNRSEKGERDADGILDIFDRYNFTMSEDEPMEREVAIDPEMLGKVFENLLDVVDRKSKGAFYTPREIVHYMCQESLINYLTNTLNVSEAAIRDFILYGDLMKDRDGDALTVQKDGTVRVNRTELYISEELYQLGADGQPVIDRMSELDKALADVRVADPAVGSGAFPLGMLNEIVRARQNITAYLGLTMRARDPKHAAKHMRELQIDKRNARQLKYETVRDCIFAADIEPSAVDIAQLRLWLALVIDDEINPAANDETEGHRNPLPLPNLECNILCGNSLIDEFEGIKLINESELLGNTGSESQLNWFQFGLDEQLQKLIEKQNELFKCDDTSKKQVLLSEIAACRDHIIADQLEGASQATLKRYEESKRLASKPYVLWQLDFARVFRDKGGFDIVIGNPPYGAKVSTTDKKIYIKNYVSTRTIKGVQKGSTDTFTLFIEKGFRMLSKRGFEAYIVPMSITSSDSMTALHNMLEKECSKIQVASFSNRPKQIFDSACIRTSIFMLDKSGVPLRHLFTTKLIRRTEENTIENIIRNIKYVDSFDLKMTGRYPKVGSQIEIDILHKIFGTGATLADYLDEHSIENIYYRSSGGRYYNVITPYPTGSSKEVKLSVDPTYVNLIAAIYSTSLFWFYQQIYTNGLDLKQFEMISFPLPKFNTINESLIGELLCVYNKYLEDIEANAIVHETSSYKVSAFKEYKIVKSKNLIDSMDEIVGRMYGLTTEQIEYIENYELGVRISD